MGIPQGKQDGDCVSSSISIAFGCMRKTNINSLGCHVTTALVLHVVEHILAYTKIIARRVDQSAHRRL
jgi:hypothetical protein